MPRPGEKIAKRGERFTARYGDSRRAWVDLPGVKLSLYAGGGHDNDYETVVIQIALFGKPVPFKLSLGGLTQAELSAMKEFFDLAFANALPLVKQRDQEAQDEYDDGDTSNSRIYRIVPRIFVREGAQFGDRASLLRGSAWVDELESAIISVASKLRGPRRTVPEPNTAASVTEDNTPTLGQLPSVRNLGGAPVDLDRLQGTEADEGQAPPAG